MKTYFLTSKVRIKECVVLGGEEEKDAGRGVIPLQKVSRVRKRKRTLLSNYPMLPDGSAVKSL